MRHRGHSAASTRVWLLAVALSVSACSSSTGERPSAGSSSTAGTTTSAPSSTDRGADVVVGEEDAGTRVLLRPGQRLSVALGADFRPVEVSAAGVLDPGATSGGYPTGQPLTAVLTAVAPGEVSLSSSTDAACLHESPPCAVPQREWTLSVTVAAG
jgi:hypothetical protein